MTKFTCAAAIASCAAILFFAPHAYGKGGAKNVQPAQGVDEARVVSEISALDPAISSVRPASVREPGRARFKVVWTPAVSLRAKTPLEKQVEIAAKVASTVVALQGGVPTEDVKGGVIAFVEGDGWQPEIGQLFYRVEAPSASALVGVGIRTVDASGNASCCDDVDGLGRITGGRFEASPPAKLIRAIEDEMKSSGRE